MGYRLRIDEIPLNCMGCFVSHVVGAARICGALGYSVEPHSRDPDCPWKDEDEWEAYEDDC
jgi:hypothetical protein